MSQSYKILVIGLNSEKSVVINNLHDSINLQHHKRVSIYDETTIIYKNKAYTFIETSTILPGLLKISFNLCLVIINNYTINDSIEIIKILSQDTLIPKILIITNCEAINTDDKIEEDDVIKNILPIEYVNMFKEIKCVSFTSTERKELKFIYDNLKKQSALRIWKAIYDHKSKKELNINIKLRSWCNII